MYQVQEKRRQTGTVRDWRRLNNSSNKINAIWESEMDPGPEKEHWWDIIVSLLIYTVLGTVLWLQKMLTLREAG